MAIKKFQAAAQQLWSGLTKQEKIWTLGTAGVGAVTYGAYAIYSNRSINKSPNFSLTGSNYNTSGNNNTYRYGASPEEVTRMTAAFTSPFWAAEAKRLAADQLKTNAHLEETRLEKEKSDKQAEAQKVQAEKQAEAQKVQAEKQAEAQKAQAQAQMEQAEKVAKIQKAQADNAAIATVLGFVLTAAVVVNGGGLAELKKKLWGS